MALRNNRSEADRTGHAVSPFLRGNWSPTYSEGTWACKVTEGAIPQGFRGMYARVA